MIEIEIKENEIKYKKIYVLEKDKEGNILEIQKEIIKNAKGKDIEVPVIYEYNEILAHFVVTTYLPSPYIFDIFSLPMFTSLSYPVKYLPCGIPFSSTPVYLYILFIPNFSAWSSSYFLINFSNNWNIY